MKRLISILNIFYKYFKTKKVYNVFNTRHPKTALITYLTYPHRQKNKFSHTNHQESVTLAEVFNELGYNVDVVNYNRLIKKSAYSKYDVILGFGKSLNQLFYTSLYKRITSIYYGPGCDTEFSNRATLSRAKQVYQKTGEILLNSTRLVPETEKVQTLFADYLVVLGNEFTKRTYERPANEITAIPANYYKVCKFDVMKKDFGDAKKNYLWFGGSGVIHKGLDLVLDTFEKRTDLFLHVCAPLNNEKEFEKLYFDKLYKKENIKTYGFIDIKSALFEFLMQKCAFVIHPSASEGGCASIVTVMGNGGLIPIISESSGLDVEDFGYVFKSIDSDNLNHAINWSTGLSGNEIQKLSNKVLNYVNENHSLEIYKERLKETIKKAIFKKSNEPNARS